MYGVSKISIETSLMMISVQDVEFKGNSLARYLQIFADNGVVVDMISQSAPHGTTIDFSFTASSSDLPLVMKAISVANLDKDAKASPLISVGYSKLNLFGEEMVTRQASNPPSSEKMPVHSKTEYTGIFMFNIFYRVTLW